MRRIFVALAIIALGAWSGFSSASANAAQIRDDDYKACQAQDIAGFQSAIETLTLRSLQAGLAKVDYSRLVAEQWQKADIDRIIDRQVDAAIAQVRSEESWIELLRSLGSREKAERLSMAVAERVYTSQPFRDALEAAANDMGRQIGAGIEVASSDAGEPAARCMRAFLGPRYGSAIARVVADETRKEFEIEPGQHTARVGSSDIVLNSDKALTGAAILIARRQMARVVQRIGTRIVGSVLSRVVSVAAGGVGLALIAKDIWDFRHGVMPIVAAEMKSRASKEAVREEIALALKSQMDEQIKEIAAKTAERVVDIWSQYRSAHAKVVELSEKHATFRALLELVPQGSMPKLDQLTAIVLGEAGEQGVLTRVADGSLLQAVRDWPDAAFDVARDTGSFAQTAAWIGLAGKDLARVVTHDLHRRTKPSDFSREHLARLLALDDRLAVARLAGLDRAQRTVLIEVDPGELTSLARSLDTAQLAALTGYMTGLDKAAAGRVLRAIADNPQRMQTMAKGYVRDAVLGSADQAAAVDMALRPDVLIDVATLPADIQRVIDRKVSPVLLWVTHPVAVLVVGFFCLVILSWVWRILTWRPSRRRASPAVPASR